MRRQARALKRAGRFGDSELVHLNQRELEFLTYMWGKPTINPGTGLPEFFDWGGVLKSLAPIFVPAAAEAIGGAGTLGSLGELFGVSAPWASTAASAGLGALTGGGLAALSGKNPLTGALTGGLSGATVPSAGRALGFNGFETPFNIPTLFDLGSAFDAAPSLSSVAAGTTAAETASPFASKAASAAADTAKEGGWLSRNPWALPLAAAGVSVLAGTPSQQQTSKTAATPTHPPSWNDYKFPTERYERKRRTASSNRPGEYQFFEDNQLPDVPISVARGGALSSHGALSTNSRRISGPGDARDDKIPAMLSNKEYVLDGEFMALLGNGDPDAGADKVDRARVKLRKQKGGALSKGRISPDAGSFESYLS